MPTLLLAFFLLETAVTIRYKNNTYFSPILKNTNIKPHYPPDPIVDFPK